MLMYEASPSTAAPPEAPAADSTSAVESSRVGPAPAPSVGAEVHREKPAVRQIRHEVETLLADNRVDDAVELLLSALAVVVDRVGELEKRIRDALRRRPKSEKVDIAQLRLALEELAVAVEPGEPDIDDELKADAALDKEIEQARQAETQRSAGIAGGGGTGAGAEKNKKRGNGRNQALRTEGLPRRITEVPVPEDMRDWVQIGVKTVERLAFSPSHFYIDETRQPVLLAPEAVAGLSSSDEAPHLGVPGGLEPTVDADRDEGAPPEDLEAAQDVSEQGSMAANPAGSPTRPAEVETTGEDATPEPLPDAAGAVEAAETAQVDVETSARAAERPDAGRLEPGPARIVTVEGPPTLLAGSMAGISVYVEVTLAKFEQHQPLHRQHRAWLRDQALYVPVSTMAGWICHVGQAFRRLHTLLVERMHRAQIVQMDGTGLQVLDPGPEHVHRGTIWSYIGRPDEPGDPYDVVFVYAKTAEGEGESGPWSTLAGRHGPIVCDASNTHDRLFNGKVAHAVEVGCNAHARRKFKPLVETGDPRAAYPVQLYKRLYRLETLADAQHLTIAERTEFRQQRSRPILDKLHTYLARLVLSDTPGSDLTKACAYALRHWVALTRFVDDGRLPLDNNRSESQIRWVRLGENNYLFAGSDDAAERMAYIGSVLATAKAHGLNLRVYLTDVLTRLASPCSRAHIEAMLPGNWAPQFAP